MPCLYVTDALSLRYPPLSQRYPTYPLSSLRYPTYPPLSQRYPTYPPSSQRYPTYPPLSLRFLIPNFYVARQIYPNGYLPIHKLIIIPFRRIFNNILSNAHKRLVVSDDVFVKTGLPCKIGINYTSVFCNGRFI